MTAGRSSTTGPARCAQPGGRHSGQSRSVNDQTLVESAEDLVTRWNDACRPSARRLAGDPSSYEIGNQNVEPSGGIEIPGLTSSPSHDEPCRGRQLHEKSHDPFAMSSMLAPKCDTDVNLL